MNKISTAVLNHKHNELVLLKLRRGGIIPIDLDYNQAHAHPDVLEKIAAIPQKNNGFSNISLFGEPALVSPNYVVVMVGAGTGLCLKLPKILRDNGDAAGCFGMPQHCSFGPDWIQFNWSEALLNRALSAWSSPDA